MLSGLATVPFIALFAATCSTRPCAGLPARPWYSKPAANLILPTAIAVFAAARTANLYRRAYDAEGANEIGHMRSKQSSARAEWARYGSPSTGYSSGRAR